MKTIELIGHIDEHNRLHADVPHDLPPGRVRLIVLLSDEDAAGDMWAQGVAKEWADELSNVHQDLYTLEDGQAIVEEGFDDWAKSLPQEDVDALVDPSMGAAVRWMPGRGWVKDRE